MSFRFSYFHLRLAVIFVQQQDQVCDGEFARSSALLLLVVSLLICLAWHDQLRQIQGMLTQVNK